MDGKHVLCHFGNIQYIPGMTYSLLSWGVLDDCGLYVKGGDGVIKFLHHDGSVVIEPLKKTG